jgi:hypothetical protein
MMLMLTRRAAVLFAFIFAFSAVAGDPPGPTITSVTPSTGFASGGTVVTIRGTGFDAALDPRVSFGRYGAPVQANVVDATTLVAIAPAYLPGPAEVRVSQGDGTAILQGAFTFIGPLPEQFERILVPLLIPPVAGAFGAIFETSLTLSTKRPETMVNVHGLRMDCLNLPCPWDRADTVEVGHGEARIRSDALKYDGTPGRFLYVRRDDAFEIAAHLRVRDVTRTALNLGTELPLVRASEFNEDRLYFENELPSNRYRTSLRIYAPAITGAHVLVEHLDGTVTDHAVDVNATGTTIYDPAYGYFGDFPEEGWLSITVVADRPPFGSPMPPEVPVWAFVTLTNNETQMITTITPQP